MHIVLNAANHDNDSPLKRNILQRAVANFANWIRTASTLPSGQYDERREILPSGKQARLRLRDGEIVSGGVNDASGFKQ